MIKATHKTKGVRIYNSDVLEYLKTCKDNMFDAVLCDPPYAIDFMGKNWDRALPGVEVWEELLRVCKPGASLLSFGGTRMFHRLMCNIEDAGWQMRDTIGYLYSPLLYVYGSGFPKSQNISNCIEKMKRGYPQGTNKHDPDNPNTGKYKTQRTEGKRSKGDKGQHFGAGPGSFMKEKGKKVEYVAVDNDAQQWSGYGTAIKPAYEPIVIAMAPLDGTYVQNALKWGVAGVNVDGCRVGADGGGTVCNNRDASGQCLGHPLANGSLGGGVMRHAPEHTGGQGRWPANLILQHHPDCKCVGKKKVKGIKGGGGVKIPGKHGVYGKYDGHEYPPIVGYASKDGTETVDAWECVEGCPVRMLDEQSGDRKSGVSNGNAKKGVPGKTVPLRRGALVPRHDTGGASRFFYTAKASRSEREEGLLGHIPCTKCGVLDSVEHFVHKEKGVFTESQLGKDGLPTAHKIRFRIKNKKKTKWMIIKCTRNLHPTVKPLSICEYIAKLCLPPKQDNGIRRLLVPFSGVGSEMIGALRAGWDRVYGIDFEEDYCNIAFERLKHAQTS